MVSICTSPFTKIQKSHPWLLFLTLPGPSIDGILGGLRYAPATCIIMSPNTGENPMPYHCSQRYELLVGWGFQVPSTLREAHPIVSRRTVPSTLDMWASRLAGIFAVSLTPSSDLYWSMRYEVAGITLKMIILVCVTPSQGVFRVSGNVYKTVDQVSGTAFWSPQHVPASVDYGTHRRCWTCRCSDCLVSCAPWRSRHHDCRFRTPR